MFKLRHPWVPKNQPIWIDRLASYDQAITDMHIYIGAKKRRYWYKRNPLCNIRVNLLISNRFNDDVIIFRDMINIECYFTS